MSPGGSLSAESITSLASALCALRDRWGLTAAEAALEHAAAGLSLEDREALVAATGFASSPAQLDRRLPEIVLLTVPHAVIVTDARGVVQRWNPAATTLYGWTADEAVGQPIGALRLADVPEDVGRQILQSMFEGKSWVGEFVGRRRDGTMFPVFTSNTPQVGPEGRVIGVIGVATDLTEQKRADAERERLRRRSETAERLEGLGLIASRVAHDFNNLLVPMLANAELAIDELPAGSSARPALDQVIIGAQRATELVSQLLSDAGRRRATAVPTEVASVVTELCGLLEATVRDRVRLVSRLEGRLPKVIFDPTQLRQVLLNLLTNSLQAITGAGQVTIEATVGRRPHEGDERATTDELVLSVTDDGCGMDEATRLRIFEPFFTTRPSGRGLGLAGVHAMVHAHGGALAVETELGRGTTMRLWLPLAPHAGAPLSAASARAAGGLSLDGFLLVVDDDEHVSRSVARLLGRLGVATKCVASGEAALALLADPAGAIRVALIDLSMPGMRGDELARRIAERTPRVPVILMSGDVNDLAIEALPVAGCLQKPFLSAELSATLAPIFDALKR
jgi:two-component system, cell cycle sensor histidine kinase and response regulator CckA